MRGTTAVRGHRYPGSHKTTVLEDLTDAKMRTSQGATPHVSLARFLSTAQWMGVPWDLINDEQAGIEQERWQLALPSD